MFDKVQFFRSVESNIVKHSVKSHEMFYAIKIGLKEKLILK